MQSSTSAARRTLATVALLAAACGGPAPERAALAVTVDGPVAPYAPDYLAAPDLEAHVVAAATNAAQAWGGGPGALDGYRVVLEQKPFDCGRAGDEADRIVGCTWANERLIQVLALGAACPEATSLAHEVGHAVIGDAAHRDGRWSDAAFWRGMLEVMRRTAPQSCSLAKFSELNEIDD